MRYKTATRGGRFLSGGENFFSVVRHIVHVLIIYITMLLYNAIRRRLFLTYKVSILCEFLFRIFVRV